MIDFNFTHIHSSLSFKFIKMLFQFLINFIIRIFCNKTFKGIFINIRIVELGYTEDYDIDKLYNTDIYKNALESLIAENPDDKIYEELKKHFDEFE